MKPKLVSFFFFKPNLFLKDLSSVSPGAFLFKLLFFYSTVEKKKKYSSHYEETEESNSLLFELCQMSRVNIFPLKQQTLLVSA